MVSWLLKCNNVPLWMMNSAAFGGGEEKRFPMWTKVSSTIPVLATFEIRYT